MEKPSIRSSTAASKARTSQDKEKATSDESQRPSGSKKPATKFNIQPKRPLTTPRGPSFTSDRSRSNPSVVSSSGSTSSPHPASKATTLSKATKPVSTGVRRTSTVPHKQPVPSARSRATPSIVGSPQQNCKGDDVSPTSTEFGQMKGDEADKPGEDEGMGHHELVEDLDETQGEKEDEITRLSEEMEYLKTSLTQKTEEAKKESNARVVDLESELEDTQTKLRQSEANAESAKIELDSKGNELEDLQRQKEHLDGKLNSMIEEREKDLLDADRLHAQQLKDAASRLESQTRRTEEVLRDTIARQIQDHKDTEAQHQKQLKSTLDEKQKELEELQAKHKQASELASKGRESEIQKVRENSEAQLANARKELEQARKVAKDAETTRTDLQKEVEEARKSVEEEKSSKEDLEKEFDGLEALRQELEDQQAKLKLEHELALENTKRELAEVWKRLEEEKKDSTGYERELADLRVNHDRELHSKLSDLQKLQVEISKHEDKQNSAKIEEERRIKEAEARSEQKLADALNQIRQLEEASLEHEQHFRNIVQKHRKDMEEHDKNYERKLKEREDCQSELEYAIQQSKRELSEALKHQNEAYVEKEQSKKECEAALRGQQELERLSERNKKDLEEVLEREGKAQIDLALYAKQLDEAARTKKEQEDSWENERQMKSKRIEEFSRRQQDLESQISQQKKYHECTLDEARKKHENLEDSAEQDKKMLEEALSHRQDLENRVAEQSKALDEAQKHGEQVTRDLNLAKSTVENLREEHAKEISDLASKYENNMHVLKSEHVQEVEGLRATVAELKSVVDTRETQAGDSSALEEVNVQHQKDLDSLKHKHRVQQQAAAKSVVEFREALQKANSAQEAAEQARSDLETQLRDKSMSGEKELEALKESNAGFLEQIAALQASVDKAASDRKEGVEMIRSQKKKLEVAEQAKSILEKQLREAATTQQEQLRSLKGDQKGTLSQQAVTVKAAVEKVASKRKEDVEYIKILKSQVAELSRERDAAHDQVNNTPTKTTDYQGLQQEYQAALEKIVTLQAAVDSAAEDRKQGVEMIRAQKKELQQQMEMYRAQENLVSDLQATLESSKDRHGKEDNAIDNHLMEEEKKKIERERDVANEQVTKLQAYCRIVDAERNELASTADIHSATLEEANSKVTQLLEEAAKFRAIAARREHELQQRLRHLDAAHNEALANATSLAQQLHSAKANHAHVDDLKRQLDEMKQEKESARVTDHVDQRPNIGVLGRQYTIGLADVEALRADMEREREEREIGWRRGAEGRKRLLGELESARSVWAHPVGEAI